MERILVLVLCCVGCSHDLYREGEPSYDGRESLEAVRVRRVPKKDPKPPSKVWGELVVGSVFSGDWDMGPSFKVLWGISHPTIRPILGGGFQYISVDDKASMTYVPFILGMGIGPELFEMRLQLRPTWVQVDIADLGSQNLFRLPTSLGVRARTHSKPSFGLELNVVKDWQGEGVVYEAGLTFTF